MYLYLYPFYKITDNVTLSTHKCGAKTRDEYFHTQHCKNYLNALTDGLLKIS